MPRDTRLPVADRLCRIGSTVKAATRFKQEKADSHADAGGSVHGTEFATHELPACDDNLSAEPPKVSWSNSREIAAYQFGVFQATGVHLDIDEDRLHEAPRLGPMCVALAGASPWCRDCRSRWCAARPPIRGGIEVRPCHGAAELLRYRMDVPPGTVVSRHVLSRPSTMESVQQMLLNLGRVVDSDRYASALAVLSRTPVIEPARMHAAMRGLAELIGMGFSSGSDQRNDADADPRIIVVARRFVAAYFLQPVSLGAVAQAAGVSSTYFCRVFRRWCGCTLVEYVSRTRINYACGLLKHDERRISDIALSCGFGSPARFYEAFKLATGVSPTEYRIYASQSG